MPLSEHEQRLLDEIEQALYAEDPKFASSVRSVRSRSRVRRTVVLCVFGVLLGLGLVLIGLVTNLIVLSIVGFVLVVGAVGYGVQVVRPRAGVVTVQAGPSAGRPQHPQGLRGRMEERLRRRFDES